MKYVTKEVPGYVYMVQFKHNGTHYKIGSSKDPFARMNQIACEYGELNMVVCGKSENRLQSERSIQWAMRNHCNRRYYRKSLGSTVLQDNEFTGCVDSREFFIFKSPLDVLTAIISFSDNCDELYDGHFRIINPGKGVKV